MFGALLSVVSAATFGLNDAITRRGVLTGTPFQAMAISLPIGIVLFLVVALAAGQGDALTAFSPAALAYLAGAGIVHFVFGRYSNYRALQAIGANLAGPVQGTSILVSVVFALILLDESLTALQLVGIFLVVLGPSLLFGRRSGRKGGDKTGGPARHQGFQPRHLEGYFFALMSAFGYGFSPILVRAGLTEINAPLAGGVISYLGAAALLALLCLVPGQMRQVVNTPRQAARWFSVSGVTVCIAQILRYAALGLAPVTVVAPIQRLASVFRVLFGWVFNRQFEIYEGHVLAGLAVSFLGALALTIDADLLVTWVGLPDWLAGALIWRWP